jgi:hypothetical protein
MAGSMTYLSDAKQYVRYMAGTVDLTLNEGELDLLSRDCLSALHEDDCGFRQWLERIGGAHNLKPYLETLKAQQIRTWIEGGGNVG